jgi:predicted nucleic acid-binding protein
MTIFLDTNIVIALFSDKDRLHEWSKENVVKHKALGPVIICDIVFCEASVGMDSIEDLNVAIAEWGLERIAESDGALFLAGKIFKIYRNDNKGPKTGVMPDFLIGSVASDNKAPLMTGNRRDFINYFPDVTLIAPAD